METLQRLVQERFGLALMGISAFFILLFLRSQNRASSKSGFKLREADRDLRFKRNPAGESDPAPEKKKAPLRLTGIVTEGAAHEVLGISALASEAEIQKAYKEKMKRYHPDLMGPPGSREWHDASKIAEAINRARTEMLERLKRRS